MIGSSGSSSMEKIRQQSHFNDWPNTQGFDTSYEERSPVELQVEGTIPNYAAGVLFRTGLGPRTVKTKTNSTFKVNHWFDGFSQIHRFQIHDVQRGETPRVTYNSRLVTDGIISEIKRTGKLDTFTFASQYDPCKTFFSKIQATFQSLQSQPTPAPNAVNTGVTMSANFPGLSKIGKQSSNTHTSGDLSTLCTKTDAPVFQMLDPETLEPIGVAKQTTLHPDLKGAGSAAHAKSDPQTGDVYNYNLDFGRTGTYRVFRASASTGKTSVIATFPYAPAYLHSLFLTENYVVICVWNSYYSKGGASILWNKNLLDSMYFDGSKPTTWFVIDKRLPEEGGKGVVATFESDPLYCFHTINAYEEPNPSNDGSNDIIADLAAYKNMDVLDKFYYHNLLSDSPQAAKWSDPSNTEFRPTYRRYRLESISSKPNKKLRRAVLEFQSQTNETPELPTLNPNRVTKKHRYVYGINDSGRSTFADSLVKYDTETKSVIRWSKHGHTAGEAIFVPDPDSNQEDGGVLLTVVLDGIQGKSYLLVLNAKDLTEMGRAHVDGAIGIAFHGLYLGAGGKINKTNGMNV